MVDSCLHCKFRNGAWRPRAAFQDRLLSFEYRIIYIDLYWKIHQILTIFRISFRACAIFVSGHRVNVALGCVTYQQSTRTAGGASSRAVDGFMYTTFDENSCTHTLRQVALLFWEGTGTDTTHRYNNST